MQFKDKLTARASAPGSTTAVTPQSGDSTVTTEAAAAATAATAAAAASAAQRPPLSRDDIEDAYQSYIREWEIHDDWIKQDAKAYDIMRRHTKDNCKPVLRIRTSFEA